MLTECCRAVIIVGIGRADFKKMDILDADEKKKLKSRKGIIQERDIVQFVPFRDFVGQPPEALAAKVLFEVPDQVVGCALCGCAGHPRVPRRCVCARSHRAIGLQT